jgi:hypothetical protein
MSGNSINLGNGGKLLIGILLMLSFLTINPYHTFAAVLFVPIAAKLLWRRNEPPFLFLAIVLQWTQVCVKVFYADFYNLPFSKVFEFQRFISEAYFLSLIGLMTMCSGIWLILRKVPILERKSFYETVNKYDTKRIAVVYLLACVLIPVIKVIGNSSGGMQQFFEKLVNISWSLFLIFYLIVHIKNEHSKLFYVIFSFQLLLSFTGFYSSFKEFFMFLLLGYLMLHQKNFRLKQLLVIGILGITGFNVFVVWTYIKPEYRSYLNSSTKNGKEVTPQDSFKKLNALVSKMNSKSYDDGVKRLIERTSYIDYFSAALQHVPAVVKHEDGNLWKEALLHVVTPRIFFPNKPIIDDSKLASEYTGVEMAGLDKGTSITLGYMGESYVDFGTTVMFVPIFLFGLGLGIIYKHILSSSINQVWGIALVLPLFFQLNLFEQALIKMVGGTIAYFMVLAIIKKFGLIGYLNKKLIAGNISGRQTNLGQPKCLPKPILNESI